MIITPKKISLNEKSYKILEYQSLVILNCQSNIFSHLESNSYFLGYFVSSLKNIGMTIGGLPSSQPHLIYSK